MMGWQLTGSGCPMNAGYAGMEYLAVLLWIVIFADLILLGIFLWKKIVKK